MTQNRIVKVSSGWLMLFIDILLYVMPILLFINSRGAVLGILLASVILFLAVLVTPGFFIVNPNYSALLVLFGKYKGTVVENGFFWANPFLTKHKISLRVRNQETSRLKVNDESGNPIEIAAVVGLGWLPSSVE